MLWNCIFPIGKQRGRQATPLSIMSAKFKDSKSILVLIVTTKIVYEQTQDRVQNRLILTSSNEIDFQHILSRINHIALLLSVVIGVGNHRRLQLMPKYMPTPQQHTLSTKGGIFGLLFLKAALLLFDIIQVKTVGNRIKMY